MKAPSLKCITIYVDYKNKGEFHSDHKSYCNDGWQLQDQYRNGDIFTAVFIKPIESEVTK
jgi:hypothetical protein